MLNLRYYLSAGSDVTLKLFMLYSMPQTYDNLINVQTFYPKLISWQQPLFEVGLKRIEKRIWIHIETTNFGIFLISFIFIK